jgi:urease accessory protein
VAAPQCAFGGSFLSDQNPYGRLSILEAAAVQRGGAVILENIRFTAPLKLLPPHPLPGGGVKVTQLSVSAGLMAGDRQEINLSVGDGARVVWTSQSFEKIHKMPAGAWAQRNCRLALSGGAFLDYCPQPVIPFAGSDFSACTRINLADASAALIYRDIFCTGRIARGEQFRFRNYCQLVELRLADRLIFRENTILRPDEQSENAPLDGPGFFEGYSHLLTMILYIPGLSEDQLRLTFPVNDNDRIAAALTALDGGAFLIRALGHSAEELQNLGEELATCLREKKA